MSNEINLPELPPGYRWRLGESKPYRGRYGERGKKENLCLQKRFYFLFWKNKSSCPVIIMDRDDTPKDYIKFINNAATKCLRQLENSIAISNRKNALKEIKRQVNS